MRLRVLAIIVTVLLIAGCQHGQVRRGNAISCAELARQLSQSSKYEGASETASGRMDASFKEQDFAEKIGQCLVGERASRDTSVARLQAAAFWQAAAEHAASANDTKRAASLISRAVGELHKVELRDSINRRSRSSVYSVSAHDSPSWRLAQVAIDCIQGGAPCGKSEMR